MVISEKSLEILKKRFPSGSRVKLRSMDDPHAPPEGSLGTVVCVDDIGTVHVNWDNGACLGVVYGIDFITLVE